MSFVHLHCHSEYSLLDGANRIDDLIEKAQEFEQPALAITDHGNLHAAWEFQEKAKKAGVKPIIGMEAYVAPGDRRQRGRSATGERSYYHLVLLARDIEGYRNLVKLSSLAYTEGFYGKPRVDRELLAKYNKGIIVSSACMAGEIATHLLAERFDEAKKAAEWYADVFKDRYFLEVQAHDAGEQARLNKEVFRLAKATGLSVVATNDSHFLRAEDHESHDVLLCIGLKKDRLDADRMRYDNGLYFKSAPEVLQRFQKNPEVLENTLRVAEEVSVEFGKKYHLPAFPLPKGAKTENDLLVKLATAGAKERYGSPLPKNAAERLEYELGVITKTGYAGYFLIVADFIKAARDRGIPVGPGRGSAAGSLVAYSLWITDVDPLKFDLLFERFLNPERVSMPDIDVDFCEERRGEVLEYVRAKYGRDCVGQIITFGTLKSRAAIKDVGRVLGFTPAETDAIAKLIPNQPNFSLTVKEAIEKVPDVRRLYEQDDRHQQLLDFAIALEGLSRHAGVHAAGVVIAPGPLDDYVPVCTQETKGSGGAIGSSSDDERVVVTQFDMNSLEKAGMLKMDFLGLTTLTIIHHTLENIKARGREVPNLATLSLDDELTYRTLRAGRTAGVFQFESPVATDMLRSMRADRFDDLVASNALIRPGPLDAGMHRVYCRRKRGEEAVSYALPELEEILSPTYGVITYQEQVMRIAQRLAGISLAEADVLRKAVGKKDAELIRKEIDKFVEKAVNRGYDKHVIAELAAQIETFGRYGFNKSHSVAYSVLSYHTAYLKVHYPAEFMASLLSACIGETDSVVKYINEARDLGLEILPPDVNESGYRFTVIGDQKIRFGLGAIRNVGESAIESIIRGRSGVQSADPSTVSRQPYTSLYDFAENVDLRLCNKRVFEALLHAGAFDGLGGHRAQFAAAIDGAISAASLDQAEKATGQGSLFGASVSDRSAKNAVRPSLPNVPQLSEHERLTKEKEILGFYISGHPLEPFRAECELLATHTVASLGTWHDQPMSLGCVVTAIKRQISRKSGNEFARLTVEDFSGTGEVLVFPEAWAAIADRVVADVPVLLKGAYGRRDQNADNPTFIVESITRLAELRTTGQISVAIDLAADASISAGVLQDIRAVVEAHPGSAPLEVRWKGADGQRARMRSASLKVSPASNALLELRALLGNESVQLVRSA